MIPWKYITSFMCFSVMFERLAKHGRQNEKETKEHIKKYAEAGLRTLVITYRELDEDEYRIWEEEFLKAKNLVSEDRDTLIDAAADKIEKDLILLGSTAVEDKLQKGVSITNTQKKNKLLFTVSVIFSIPFVLVNRFQIVLKSYLRLGSRYGF